MELLERLSDLRARARFGRTAGHGTVARGGVSRSFLTVARGQLNFKFIELFPLGFRSLFLGYREKGSQALARGRPLRFIHGEIVPLFPEGTPVA